MDKLLHLLGIDTSFEKRAYNSLNKKEKVIIIENLVISVFLICLLSVALVNFSVSVLIMYLILVSSIVIRYIVLLFKIEYSDFYIFKGTVLKKENVSYGIQIKKHFKQFINNNYVYVKNDKDVILKFPANALVIKTYKENMEVTIAFEDKHILSQKNNLIELRNILYKDNELYKEGNL